MQHCPQQSGMVERVIRTLKEQCVHRQRFETLQHANQVISDWIWFYNLRRPHQFLGMKTPADTYQYWKLAARPVKKRGIIPLGAPSQNYAVGCGRVHFGGLESLMFLEPKF